MQNLCNAVSRKFCEMPWTALPWILAMLSHSIEWGQCSPWRGLVASQTCPPWPGTLGGTPLPTSNSALPLPLLQLVPAAETMWL